MKLYGSLTSPYVRKLRILLREKGISCEFVQADAWAADSPVPRLNPLGKVPVLERDDGSALYDSPVILEYLDSLKAPVLLALTTAQGEYGLGLTITLVLEVDEHDIAEHARRTIHIRDGRIESDQRKA